MVMLTTIISRIFQVYTSFSSPSLMFLTYHIEGDKKGVVLQTGAGDTEGCPNNIERSSTITLVCTSDYIFFVFNLLFQLCDETSKEPNITFIGESPQCHYNFEITSIYACPVSPETQIKNCPVYPYCLMIRGS